MITSLLAMNKTSSICMNGEFVSMVFVFVPYEMTNLDENDAVGLTLSSYLMESISNSRYMLFNTNNTICQIYYTFQ